MPQVGDTKTKVWFPVFLFKNPHLDQGLLNLTFSWSTTCPYLIISTLVQISFPSLTFWLYSRIFSTIEHFLNLSSLWNWNSPSPTLFPQPTILSKLQDLAMHMLVFKMLVVNLLLGNRLNAFSILPNFVINPLQSKCYFHSAVLKNCRVDLSANPWQSQSRTIRNVCPDVHD